MTKSVRVLVGGRLHSVSRHRLTPVQSSASCSGGFKFERNPPAPKAE